MTELIWDGKYKDKKKQPPIRIALPFQTIETINESASDRQKRLDSLFNAKQDAGDWRNRLIWGDKKYVLPSLLPEFAGKVNLIYIDPPFNVGADFSFTATLGDAPDNDDGEPASFEKQPSILEMKAYRDTWGKGLDSYLQWFYETAILLRELLAEDGSLYVHLDWHVGHYAKIVLDEVFGYENFLNEIIWKRSTAKNDAKQGAKQFGRIHDVIFFYSKSANYKFNTIYQPYSEEYIKTTYSKIDETGRRFKATDLSAAKAGGDTLYEWKGHKPPKGRYWAFSYENMLEFERQNRIFYSESGKPYLKQYLDEMQGVSATDLWDEFPGVTIKSERVEYATQKPEALLERIIKASSNEGDLVLDCFCGSGTTVAVAEKLGRRWIACDLGRFAIHTTRKRLLGIAGVKPFVVQNLGKYERQAWARAEFENPEGRIAQEKRYRKFILDLYHANSLEGYVWLHGAKAGRLVHVGSVDAPITVEDVRQTVLEFWRLSGKEKAAQTTGIDFLGWEFAFDVNETAKQFAEQNKVQVKFKKIPREVLEKKAVEQGDIKFYELASLDVAVEKKKNEVSITLKHFIMPPDDVPAEAQSKVTHWSQWIDYWSIDWNYRNDTFHNEWQSYRTKQNPKIELSATNVYEASGKYVALVKVIDILGNDTTKALEVEV